MTKHPLDERYQREIWPRWMRILAEHERFLSAAPDSLHGNEIEALVHELFHQLTEFQAEALATEGPEGSGALHMAINTQRAAVRVVESVYAREVGATAKSSPETAAMLRSRRLGLLLQRMRTEAPTRLTQEGMAERLEVSRQMVNHLERGRNEPTMDRLFEWADITEHDIVIEAFSRNDPRQRATRAMLDLLSGMPDAAVAAVADVARVFAHLPSKRRAQLLGDISDAAVRHHPLHHSLVREVLHLEQTEDPEKPDPI